MFAVVTYIFPSTKICVHNYKFKLVNWLIVAHNSCALNLDFSVEADFFTDSNSPRWCCAFSHNSTQDCKSIWCNCLDVVTWL